MTLTFRNAQEAFEDAIKSGLLSPNEQSRYFAGRYMYMGSRDGGDLFKHIDTREYLTSHTG